KKIIITSISLLLLSINIVSAGTVPLDGLERVREPSGFSTSQNNPSAMAELIGTMVQVFLSILGIIFVILMLYSGYKWMMAQGDEKNI
ncbi:hypothetical protein, partial [Enterococcus faecium]|uniref:hypothetical protein n=1 Tax=Enterococcus faecium TaxID=1352 RepID=UPI003DA11726